MGDVARLAGVSIGTVSRVMTNSDHPVGEETRRKVLEAAAAVDFTPNALARGLSGGRTHTVGVIVHDITDSYFNEIVRGIDDVAAEHGYLVLVSSSYREPERELDYVRKLRSQRCEGIIFVGGGLRDQIYLDKLGKQLKAITDHGGAVALLAPHELSWPSIVPDSTAGIRKLVDHLVAFGHRDFALMEGPAHLKTSHERAGAFEGALAAHGIALDPDLRGHGDFEREAAARALEEWLDGGKPFTAVVCLNDQMAVGCLMAARRRGIGVPDDLSIAGFDDLPVTQVLDPPLTTVRVPMRELGREGMRLLLAQLEGQDVRSHRKVGCDLVVRDSTGPVPSARPPSKEQAP